MNITTTLPALDELKYVSNEDMLDFRKNGHTLIKHVLNEDEVMAYREVIAQAAEKYNEEKTKSN